MGAMGVGGLGGAVISANADHLPRKGLVMLAGGALMGTGYLVFALMPWFWPALLVIAIASTGRMLFQVMSQTTLQVLVPDEYRGRVMSLMMMSFGMMPLGVLPVAIAIDHLGARATIAVHSIIGVLVIVGLVLLSSTLRNLRLSALEEAELSPAQAATLVASGEITQEEADLRTGRGPNGAAAAPTGVEEARGEPVATERLR
jgi:predicted MFS family arabinose efflux permease